MSISTDNMRRLRASISGEKPDKQPFLFFINFPLIKSVTGVDLGEYFCDPKTMMDAQVETYRRIGLDGPLAPDYGVVAECSGLGSEIVYDKLGFPSVHNPVEQDLEALVKLPPGDPLGGNLMTKALEALEYMKLHVPTGFRVENCGVVGPFTTAAQLRGINDFCVELYTDPELVEQLVEVATETIKNFCREQERILGRLEHLLVYDDTTSFLNENNYRRFAMPYYDKLYSDFPGVERWLHNDANCLHLAPLIAESGFKLWHTGSCFDIMEARRLSRGEVSLCGNLSPLDDVRAGDEESAYAAAKAQIVQFDGDPKLILSTGGFVSYGTPVENIKALIRAALDT